MMSKFLLLLCASLVSTSRVISANDESKINRGQKASRSVSYVVAITKDMKDQLEITCMGTVLTEKHFITACHCVLSIESSLEHLMGLKPKENILDRRYVVHAKGGDLGERTPLDDFKRDWIFGLNRMPSNTILEVEGGIPHKDCLPTEWIWKNDVGLVYTKTNLEIPWRQSYKHFFSFDKERSEIQYKQMLDGRNRTCYTYGWGTLRTLVPDSRENFSAILNEVEQVVVDWLVCMNFCQGFWKESLCRSEHFKVYTSDPSNKYCAYRTQGRIGGPCYGDSGAPLVCEDESDPIFNETVYIVGILAASLHCGQFTGGPFFYYKLTPFWDFLSEWYNALRPTPTWPDTPPPPSTRHTTCVYHVIPPSMMAEECRGVERRRSEASVKSSFLGGCFRAMIYVMMIRWQQAYRTN